MLNWIVTQFYLEVEDALNILILLIMGKDDLKNLKPPQKKQKNNRVSESASTEKEMDL